MSDTDRPPSKPEFPSMPLDAVIEASSDLADGKLRRALVLLVTKIDKGFSSILFYMRSIRERVALVARQQEEQENRLRAIEDQFAALTAKREMTAALDEARERENTARHQLAKVQGEARAREKLEAKEEKVAERTHEWKQLGMKWKIAAITAVAGILTAIATGTFKVAEALIKIVTDGGE